MRSKTILPLWDLASYLQRFSGFEYDNMEVRGFTFDSAGIWMDSSFYFKYIPCSVDGDIEDAPGSLSYCEIETKALIGSKTGKDGFLKILSFMQRHNLNIARRDGEEGFLVAPCPPEEYKAAHSDGRICCKTISAYAERPISVA